MNTHDFKPGDIVQHFKREMIEGEKGTQFLYEIICVASHTENTEVLVIYKSLYGMHQIYARPLNMFMSKVDKKKYPNIKQNYRFEMYCEKEI